MALIGLSLLIVSISFLCYRNQSFYRPWIEWFKRPSIQAAKKPPLIERDNDEEGQDGEKDSKDTNGATSTKEDEDRKAMPPPPPPSLKKQSSPASPTTPRATPASTSSSSIPSFNLDNSPPAPSFPAINSAQRASSGARAPPRLNPVPPPPSSLMPPPSRSPLPNRLPPPSASSGSFSLAPPPSHSSVPNKPSRKVLLTPGHSPLDWARLSSASSSVNLRGVPAGTPYLKVPPSMLRKYTGRKGKDAWTVLGGKVYNITPYLPFHPGGEPELLRAAGRDGSRLFGEVHPWVNWEGMLEGCLIGIAVDEQDVNIGASPLEDMD